MRRPEAHHSGLAMLSETQTHSAAVVSGKTPETMLNATSPVGGGAQKKYILPRRLVCVTGISEMRWSLIPTHKSSPRCWHGAEWNRTRFLRQFTPWEDRLDLGRS